MAYRSGRLSVARDRFEVLGVRGDINKSTTFGTEDKCNPLEATIGAALRYQTLRSLTATEIGAGTVNVAKMVRGGSLCVRWGIMISPPGEALSFGVGPKPMEIELPFIQNGGNFGQSPFWRSVIGE